MKFAAALNQQGRFANTRIGDFLFVPEFEAHVWQGKSAETASELAEQVNGAIASLIPLNDPFLSLRVLPIGSPSPVAVEAAGPDEATPQSVKEALVETNGQLQKVVTQMAQPRPTLKLVEEAVL